MELITPAYRALNAEMHGHGGFGIGSGMNDRLKYAVMLLTPGCRTVLDYGCGRNLACKKLLPNHHVRSYDPCVSELSALPEPADLLVCLDVLEHIEPPLLNDVLKHIKSLIKVRGFIVIACNPSRDILPDGTNAHRIVETPKWWIEKLLAAGLNVKFAWSSDTKDKDTGRPGVEVMIHVGQGIA